VSDKETADVVGLAEAARNLLEARDARMMHVGYRVDLWECLRANLAAIPAPALAAADDDGWIMGNAERNQWRSWRDGFPAWTEKPLDATRYARRCDAEAVHANDEDAWCVILLSEAIRYNLQGLALARECDLSPSGRHQVDTSMESGPNNCFHCERPMR